MSIYLLATLDTKGTEAEFVRASLRSWGHDVRLVDVGCLNPATVEPDVSRHEFYQAGGFDCDALSTAGDRGRAIEAAAAAARQFARHEHDAGRLSAIISLGGSAGTTIGTAAMRSLPLGLPKVMVSTLASGNVRPYVADKDIVMVNSIVDLAGLNRISRRVLHQAAAALSGMLTASVSFDRSAHQTGGDMRPLIAATMFGVTTPCVEAARSVLEEAGYEVLVFHATGNGGQAMESLISDGVFAGILDITTTELADELVGGVLSAGPERLTAAGRCGVPQVVSVGALDMVNFGPRDTVPAAFQNRQFYQHNPTVTLMRTTVEENRELARQIAQKLSTAQGPAVIYLPQQGVSAIDAPGQPFDNPAARQALFDSLQQQGPQLEQVVLDLHINDPEFAERMARHLLQLLGHAPT